MISHFENTGSFCLTDQIIQKTFPLVNNQGHGLPPSQGVKGYGIKIPSRDNKLENSQVSARTENKIALLQLDVFNRMVLLYPIFAPGKKSIQNLTYLHKQRG